MLTFALPHTIMNVWGAMGHIVYRSQSAPQFPTHKVDVPNSNTTLFTPFSSKIWNEQLVWDDKHIQIVPIAIYHIFLKLIWISDSILNYVNMLIIHGYIGPHNHVDY